MANQILIKWSSASGADYAASVESLQTYIPIPTIQASLRLKGRLGPKELDAIVQMAKVHGLEVSMSLTASFPTSEGQQLRLFPQPRDHAPALPADFWEDFQKHSGGA